MADEPERELTREDILAIFQAARWECECPEAARVAGDEMPSLLCARCRARRWQTLGVELSEELS